MRIASVELRRVQLDLRNPFVAGHATTRRRDVVLVRVALDSGTEGWGECAALERPTYSPETTAGTWALLRDELVPALLGGAPPLDVVGDPTGSVSSADRVHATRSQGAPDDPQARWRSGIAGHPMAHAALLDALLDAQLREAGRSLREELGGRPLRTVPATRVIGIVPSIDALVAAVGEAPAGVKLKIAPGWDVEPLRAVRAAYPDRWLAADANGGYGLDDLDGLRALDELGLAYLEQPLPGLTAAADASRHLATPIVLDEPIGATDTVRAAIALGGLGGINIKPGKAGGLQAAAAAIAFAAEHGVPAFVGGMLETGIGRAGALALATLEGATLPTDLGPSDRYFVPDLTDPLLADDGGAVQVPDGPGLGRTPDPARIEAATVDRTELRP